MKFVLKSLLIFLMMLHNACYAEPVLRFQKKIDSHASQLGDLLRIEPANPNWATLSLDSHPTPGEWISKEHLVLWMKQRIGTFAYSWEGKTRIQVIAPKHASGQALLEKAQQTLNNQLQTHYTTVRLKALSAPRDGEYPLDSYKVHTRVSFPVARRVCVWLQHGEQQTPVWFQVKAYAPVLVAHAPLRPDSPVQEKDFSLQTRNIAGLRSAPVQSLPKQTLLKTPVEQGEVLLSSQLKEAPQVVHGQVVKVSIQHHSIRIVMDALALSDGYRDQLIKVKNPQNQQTFTAKVTGPNQAEVLS